MNPDCVVYYETGLITVLNADLTLSHSFGGKKLFTNPNGIAIDTKGMCMWLIVTVVWYSSLHLKASILLTLAVEESSLIMYITDETKHQVMMFTTEGEFLGSFGRSGKRFLGVAVDKTGNVYVCDHNSGEVLVSRPWRVIIVYNFE